MHLQGQARRSLVALFAAVAWVASSPTGAMAARISHSGTGAAFDLFESLPGDPQHTDEGTLEATGTVARDWPKTPAGFQALTGVPATVETSFWSDAGRRTINVFSKSGSGGWSQPSVEYGNIATVLPGTSGLSAGDPVTLELSFRHSGTAGARGGGAYISMGAKFYVEGLDEVAEPFSDTVSYDMDLTYWGPGASWEGSVSWSWATEKNSVGQASASIPAEDTVVPALDGLACLNPENYRYFCGQDREFDTGIQKITVNTFVGARLWINSSAWLIASASNADDLVVTDFTAPFRVDFSPAAGSEGVELEWDIAPLTQDDTATTDAGASVGIPVLANDRAGVSLLAVTQGGNGAVTDNGDGTVTYAPTPGFSGTDTFTYTAGPAGGGDVAETATVTVTVNAVTGPAADLALTIADAPDPVEAGSTLVYSLTVTNNGPDVAEGASLGVTLPALRAGEGPAQVFVPWVELVSVTSSHGDCTESDLTLSCPLGDLDGVATVTIEVRPLASGQELTTEAVVASNLADPARDNNTATTTTTVSAAADLSVAITDTPDPFEVSGDSNAPYTRQVLYTVTVANSGPNPAQDVVLDVSVPDQAGIAITAAVPYSDGSCAVTGEKTVRCEVASLDSGGSLSFNVQTEVTGGSSLECTATAGSTTADPDIANNTALEETSGALYVDFEIASLDGGALFVGNTQTYRFRLTAAGQSPSLQGFEVPYSFVLPQELILVQVSDNAECTQQGQTLDCLTWFQNNSNQIVELTVEAPDSPGNFELLALVDHDGENRTVVGDEQVGGNRPWHDAAPGNNGVALAVPVVDEVDLAAAGVEVTQGIQNLANEMPLVAEKATVVRGYASTTANLLGTGALLHGSRGGQDLEESPLSPGNPDRVHLKPGGVREDVENGWWFVLPPAWRSGNVDLRLDVDPAGAVNDPDRTDNSVSTTVSFRDANPLNLTVLPVEVLENHVSGDPLVYTSADPGFVPIIEGVKRFHPVSTINLWEAGEPLRPSLGFHWDLRTMMGVSRLVNRVAEKAFWTTDRAEGMFYMGMVPPALSNMKAAGAAHRGGKAAWSQFRYYCKDNGRDVRCGGEDGDLWRIPGAATVAHELGHNMGLKHEPCSGDEATTEDLYPWPLPECGMAPEDSQGFFGTDAMFNQMGIEGYDRPKILTNEHIADDGVNPPAIPPQAGFPLMGYQPPRWVSPWEYCYLLDYDGIPCSWDLAGGTVDLSATPARVASRRAVGRSSGAAAASGPYLILSGSVDPVAGTAAIDSVEQIAQLPEGESVTTLDPADATGYSVELLDASSHVLATYPVLDNLDEAGGEIYGFFLVVEAPAGAVEVIVDGGGGALASVRSSANPPTVALIYPNGGESLSGSVTVHWSGSDADSDPLTYTLLYSPDAGQSWTYISSGIASTSYTLEVPGAVPGSANGLFKVIVCDGFLTGEDVSDAVFSVTGKEPVAFISQPSDGATFAYGEPVFLAGMATDLEDGPLSGGSLTWSSDLDGTLATGSDGLALTLSPGTHRISLKATDSSGRQGERSAMIEITGGPATPEPPAGTGGSSGGGGGGCFIDYLE